MQNGSADIPEPQESRDGVVLVTGATGFLGGHLVRTLLGQGRAVRATGRNLEAGLALSALGAQFLPVDLTDRAAVLEVYRGVDIVVHSGALSSAWGRYRDFYDTNITGTQNVVDGCLLHGVRRLVHISSPSVISRHEPQFNLDEDAPLPETFVSMYSETKALAEKVVEAAADKGLEIVILRPKAIYGPGDNAIFPRIVGKLATGRLPRLGDGETVTNITHVSDVVSGILLAMSKGSVSGHKYLITGGEDVRLWDVVDYIADRLGYARPTRRIPLKKAMVIAGVLEAVWRLFRLPGEPPLTRYSASIMGNSQTYDISRARTELGYQPRVRWQDGVDDFVDSLGAGPDVEEVQSVSDPRSSDPLSVPVTILPSGITQAREKLFGSGDGWSKIDIPALFALIRHPSAGSVLFDTGYSTRFFAAASGFPYALYRLGTPLFMTAEEDPAVRVRSVGVEPAEVRTIIISHFDPDHVGGLHDFPNAQVVCSWRAWAEARGKTGFKALKARVLPGLIPPGIAARLRLLPDLAGPPIGPFSASFDLFGDGSVRLVELPGHAPGMLGAFVRSEAAGPLFLCADACWSMAPIEAGTPRKGAHRFIAFDRAVQYETYGALIRLLEEMPEVTIVPAHCPATAAKLLN